MITTTAFAFLITILTSVVKWLNAKMGAIWVHVFVFLFAVLIAFYMEYSSLYPSIVDFVAKIAVLFSGAVAMYEVILNKIPFFQGPPTV